MPPKYRDSNPSGLGRAIINKVKDARSQQGSGLFTTDADAISRLKSITQERDLDEFLNTAQLAGTQFTAERRNVKIIQQIPGSRYNPYLLTDPEEKSILRRQQDNKHRLQVPRRPPWTKEMKPSQVEAQEKRAFLEWRRGLAELQEQDKFLLTPFERNIEVWRQLWRVLERSHLIVQIVDSRNPLRFRCEDLEAYVADIEGSEGQIGSGSGKRKNLLLINKADLLTAQQRRKWADYFEKNNVRYAFYSAAEATASQRETQDVSEKLPHLEASTQELEQSGPPAAFDEEEDDSESQDSDLEESGDDRYFSAEEDTADEHDPRAEIFSAGGLEDLFLKAAPDLSDFTDANNQPPTKVVVGLVGYPNVGKSSTINSLLGQKRVGVSSTPGKTKHFQTIHLSDSMILCDCPGLVFPQFATTKADLICDGVLPIDQMKEYTGPISLVIQRLPKNVLEAVYGLTLQAKGVEDDGNGMLTAEDLLVAHAIGRGFMRAGQGYPDEARSARYILKDYVNGRILFAHAPPGISQELFNERTHQLALKKAINKKRAPATRVGKHAATFVSSHLLPSRNDAPAGIKSMEVDNEFFGATDTTFSGRAIMQGPANNGQAFTRLRLFPHQNMMADDGTPLDANQIRFATTLARTRDVKPEKKHHKKGKRVKQRSGHVYDC